MPDIKCSHCGNVNPDFLDVCQFCQSPLKSESMLHTGETPEKVDTGDLEPILPDWLKDARQQNRDADEQDAVNPEATVPQFRKNEPPDLLAGLMSQSESEEEEVPDWLSGINPLKETSPSVQLGNQNEENEEEPSDFFAQFSQNQPQEPEPQTNKQDSDQMPSWVGGREGEPDQQEGGMPDWFSQSSSDDTSMDKGSGFQSGESDLGGFDAGPPTSAGEGPEDLSWLHELEEEAKRTGELPRPEPKTEFGPEASTSSDSSADDELGWLNNLGGTSIEEQPSPKETTSGEDLSWLDNLGGTPIADDSAPAQPSSGDDLGWLSNMGETRKEDESQPSEPSKKEDLNWLDNLGGTPVADELAPSETSPQEDLSWLRDRGGVPMEEESTPSGSSSSEDTSWLDAFPARQDQEISETPLPFGQPEPPAESSEDAIPDWLQSDNDEEPSMPAPGEVSMEWFDEHDRKEKSPPVASPTEEAGSVTMGFDQSSSQTQDVNSLFDIEMPDFEGSSDEVSADAMAVQPSEEGDELAPVELPSWVQAMRPVESSLSEDLPAASDQITEQEGPLAGFKGVIPSAPIGSSMRPKPVSLKLQATEEQEAGATLMEQIIAGETSTHPLTTSDMLASQRILRWVLSGVIIIVLGLVVGLGLRTMPIYASATVNDVSNMIASVPENSPVLVVIDYGPSLSGELEVAAGPVLDQLALSRKAIFTFLSTSPTGPALADRLISNTGLETDLDYQLGSQYFNVGYLPGGSAGVMGFMESPRAVAPLNPVSGFSDYAVYLVLTDTAESGRIWVEQLELAKARHPEFDTKPFLIASSAQAGPMLQPYVTSGQVDALVNGLYDGAKYEYVNNTRPGTARAYWDAFGIGLLLAVLSIVIGSVWNLFLGIRERNTAAEQG